MIRCYNCGADIENDVVECPYCHASQHGNAEKKYMNNLYSMHSSLDKLDDNALKTELRITVKGVLFLALAIIFCIALGIGCGMKRYSYYHDNRKEQAKIIESYKWYDDNIHKLDELYEKKDFDGLYDMYNKFSDNKETGFLRMWEHYGILNIYICDYKPVKRYIDDKDYMDQEWAYVSAYTYCVNFLAEANNIREDKYNPYYDSVNGNDYEILEEWEKITRNFVYNDLKVSDSEFQADIQNSYDYSSSSIRENGKKYFARVKQ